VVLEKLVSWLEAKDAVARADAILALDGGEGDNRLIEGLRLLRQGYASRLLISQTNYGSRSPQKLKDLVGDLSDKVRWMPSDALSTRDEAITARKVLNELRCASLLVVTSSYHTRRAKEEFVRELSPDGIQVQVAAAPVPCLELKSWWKSRLGRSTVLFETAKLLLVMLRLSPSLTPGFRIRLKAWVERSIP
jgi:uncharacterized SAM-binding protein YcdF (DUF218 family)